MLKHSISRQRYEKSLDESGRKFHSILVVNLIKLDKMGSESDLTKCGLVGDNCLSREGSFFSLTSTSSVYYTAENSEVESLASSTSTSPIEFLNNLSPESHRSDSPRRKMNRSEVSEESLNSNESSRTIGRDDDDSQGGISEDDDEVDSYEIRADVAKICNEIADNEDPNSEKLTAIDEAYLNADLDAIKKLAVSDGGLLTNSIRSKAWPFLLGISHQEVEEKSSLKIPHEYPNVKEKIRNIVTLDVSRVLKRFPPGLSDPQQDHLQNHLTSLICSSLEENSHAYYYQGFHDIALTLLLVAISKNSPYISLLCLDKLINTSLDPFMEKTMEQTNDLIHIIFAILEIENKKLYKKIVINSKCPPGFSIAWVLTWFSHTLPNDNDIFRLSDFILGSNGAIEPSSLIPIFISAQLVLRNAEKVMSITETDIATMHHSLAQLPYELTSLEPWLDESLKLMKKYAGKEKKLIERAVEIKDFQNELWNDDTNNNRDRARGRGRNDGPLWLRTIKGHPKTTILGIIILGTAYLIQSKYGGRYRDLVKPGVDFVTATLNRVIPNRVKDIFKIFIPLDYLDALSLN